ncbi:hypothetical protein PHBOTO_000829 [Pseudozyma hubeiensis]|nr:hypothetical protein PHBOTO_000829 [Pseudozyma hubeiensis]
MSDSSSDSNKKVGGVDVGETNPGRQDNVASPNTTDQAVQDFLDSLPDVPSPPEYFSTPSPISEDPSAPDYFLRAEICEAFITYYNIDYLRLYPDRCDSTTHTPWQGMWCDDDLIDELYHRITCFVEDMICIEFNKPPEQRTLTNDHLNDWMDIIVSRSVHEIREAGHNVGCLITDDPFSGFRCLYRRLMDYVENEAVAYNLPNMSRPPTPDSTDSGYSLYTSQPTRVDDPEPDSDEDT